MLQLRSRCSQLEEQVEQQQKIIRYLQAQQGGPGGVSRKNRLSHGMHSTAAGCLQDSRQPYMLMTCSPIPRLDDSITLQSFSKSDPHTVCTTLCAMQRLSCCMLAGAD